MPRDANEVAPRLLVGSKLVPGPHEDIDVLVLAAAEYQPPASLFPGIEVIHAPLDDDPTRPMREDEVTLAISTAGIVSQHLREGRRVLSTCAMGWNRSALIAAIAMHRVFGMTASEIVSRLRRARGPWALSNPNFELLVRSLIEMQESR